MKSESLLNVLCQKDVQSTAISNTDQNKTVLI